MFRKKIGVLIKKSSLIFDKQVNQLLASYNVTSSQFRILMILYRSPAGSVRQADLEAIFSMTNPTITGLIHKLEKNGFVKRIEHPEDKRSKLLMLTDYAESKREEFLVLADSIEKEMTKGLNESEVETLSELLMKIIEQHY